MTTQRRGLELLQHRATQVTGRGDEQTVSSGTPAVEGPVALDEGAAGGRGWCSRGVDSDLGALRRGQEGALLGVSAETARTTAAKSA